MSDYLINLKSLLTSLRTEAKNGLSNEEAVRRQRKNGLNVIANAQRRAWRLVFLERIKDVLIAVLLASTVISVATQHYAEAIIILTVVLVDACLNFVQVYRNERVLKKIKEMVPAYATVIRGGVVRKILAGELVTGDIINVREGEGVPADSRLIKSQLLNVQEEALTGVSVDVEKEVIDLQTKTPLSNRRNMLYMGTVVVSGSARAVVVTTGARTELGRIAQVLKLSQSPTSPLKRKLNEIGIRIGGTIMASVSILAVIGLAIGDDTVSIFNTVLILMVSAVPESLIIILFIALIVGVVKIHRNNGIVRELAASETIGSTTVICIDKTGTLTRGEMKVEYAGYLGKGDEKTLEEINWQAAERPTFYDLLLSSLAVLSDARLSVDKMGNNVYLGTSTERSIRQYLEEKKIDVSSIKERWRQLDAFAFDKRWKYKASLNNHPTEAEEYLFVTGAPDVLLTKSSEIIDRNEKRIELEEQRKNKLNEKINQIAATGKRLVGVAMKRYARKTSLTRDDVNNLLFLGLVIMNDPVRPEARRAVGEISQAGVVVKIVTGDHLETARAIARSVGIPAGRDCILTTEDLEKMSDEELAREVERISILARVNPLDKQRIIKALQRNGHVVAMTGDGVNDAVALRNADIGVAMGSGKDVAREAADLILLDDSFTTMVKAITEGRILKENIRKVICFLLATNAAEVTIFFISLMAGIPLPLLPAQILWVNLATNGTSGIALALEPGEKNVMRRGPEKAKARIIDGQTIYHILFTGGVMTAASMLLHNYLLAIKGYDLIYARTMAFAFISLVSLLSVWSFRSLHEVIARRGILGNKWIPILLLAAAFLQLAAIYVPALQKIFNTVPLAAKDWGLILLIALVAVVVIDLRKTIWSVFLKVSNKRSLAGENTYN